MSEYETELDAIRDAQAESSAVEVRVSSGDPAAVERLSALLGAILVDAGIDVGPAGRLGQFHRTVRGRLDESTEQFIGRLEAAEAKVAEQERALETSAHVKHDAILHAAEADEVASALERRLGDVEARRIALAVAHGDIAPDAFERRRQIAIEGVRSFVAATRMGFRQRINSRATDGDNS